MSETTCTWPFCRYTPEEGCRVCQKPPATPAQPHVTETPKIEHDARDVLTAQPAGDAELVRRLRDRVMTMQTLGGTWVTAEDYLELDAARARAEADLAAAVEALGAMLGRHVLYCGGPSLPHAGHTDRKLFDMATTTLARIKEKRT